MRGEDPRSSAMVSASAGSPPRAWGGRRHRPGETGERRLTPTCVGRTSSTTRMGASATAHPHVRGEDCAGSSCGVRVSGSPPRAWGGRPQAPVHGRFRRLTPTCVGRTAMRVRDVKELSAHPHVRGEDGTGAGRCASAPGSPPRAWGGLPVPHPAGRGGGLTPTCVGRTQVAQPEHAHAAAHPHVRGEDASQGLTADQGVGSPPRAWGGRCSSSRRLALVRLTPTCVGRTAGSPPR